MKKLLTRSLTGLCFVAVVVLAILYGDRSFFGGTSLLSNVFLFFTCVALYEYRAALRESGWNMGLFFLAVAVSIYVVMVFNSLVSTDFSLFYVVLCLLMLLPVETLFRPQRSMESLAFMYYGIIWIVVPFALLDYYPVWFQQGKLLLLAFFIAVWANDTFAYCVGSLMGKHPFFARISPKKTWEGTIGGAMLTVVTACFFPLLFPDLTLNRMEWIGFSVVVVLFGTIGDLVESMFKRFTGVKDSGGLLPGHGGVLDRFDSTLMALPFVTLYLKLII